MSRAPTRHARLTIIGSGPAGYTAAIYAARAMLEPVLIAGFEPGGQLMITTDVENYPGFADADPGPLADGADAAPGRACRHAFHLRPYRQGRARAAPFLLHGDSGTTYTCDALIIATGAKARWLGIPTEETFRGYGVSACATCDGFFYRGKDVVVVGGGNTAVEEALYLAQIARKVTIVHRRNSFRAEKILQDRLFKLPNVEVIWDNAVEEICGTDAPRGVTHVRLRNVKTGVFTEVPADGVFVAIGHQPASELFLGQIDAKPNGYIKTAPFSTATNVPGVFAAGDVTDDVYRQAVTAAGLGCMAALEAERWLAAEAHHRAAAE